MWLAGQSSEWSEVDEFWMCFEGRAIGLAGELNGEVRERKKEISSMVAVLLAWAAGQLTEIR